jgi:dipeptidyl aminopeptidase/acylaminoacyl peptidase
MKNTIRVLAGLAVLVFLHQAAFASDPEIAYRVGGTQKSIEVMDRDGSNATEVYRAPKSSPYDLRPSWSPDGGSLALSDQGTLYRIDIDQLTVYPDGYLIAPTAGSPYSGLSRPEWSPVGGEIAVIALWPAQTICVVDEWGLGDLEAIYVPPEGSDFFGSSLAWNSLGTKIAFSESTPEGIQELVIIDRATGTEEARFRRDNLEGFRSIDWARNGDPRIAFCSGSPRQDTWVYTIDTTTGIVVPVIQGRSPAWSPDNSQLVFANFSAKLKRYNFATGEVENLGAGYNPDWRRLTPECVVDQDCGAIEVCCGGACFIPPCLYDSDCDDSDICTDDTCYPCSGCESVFDPDNDPSCEEPACLAAGEPCSSGEECCSGGCHLAQGVCK